MSDAFPFNRALLCALAALAAAPAFAQPYPARLLRVIVPFPPGAGADITTRLFAPRLSEALGQSVVVENRSGRINFASTGSGSSPHLIAEMLKMQARIDVVHVPYKGTPQAVIDLLTGQVSFMFANALSVLPQVNAGRLRALAVTSAKRSVASPQLPTIGETGLPGFESGTWFAVLAPAGVPREAVTRLSAAIAKLTQHPDIREKLSAQGAKALTLTPGETAAYIKSEIAKWGKVVLASGARVD